jgi:hypothetical protein
LQNEKNIVCPLTPFVDQPNVAHALEHINTKHDTSKIHPEVVVIQYTTFLLEIVQVKELLRIDG